MTQYNNNDNVPSCMFFVLIRIGKDARIGSWARVEGAPNDPNPNKPFAKMDNNPLFNLEGKLNPSITIVGKHCFSNYFYLRYCNITL